MDPNSTGRKGTLQRRPTAEPSAIPAGSPTIGAEPTEPPASPTEPPASPTEPPATLASAAPPPPAPRPAVPPPVAPPPPAGGPTRFPPSWRLPAAIGATAVFVLIAAVVVAGGGPFGSAAATPSPSPIAAASATPEPPTPGPSPSPTPSPTPTPVPTAPPLPALLGAIGDSYTQAWSVSPAYLRDHPQFSWAIGTSKTDGVTSLLERFQSLGGSPVVVDAATSGMTMADAPRQADLVVAGARKLAPGQTAYVTFELGINDLCASPDPMTDVVTYTVELRTAITTLRSGLPAGSRILMLPVPDFAHLHDITEANPAARAKLAEPPSAQCAPYLGTNGPATVAEADATLAAYDAALEGMCDDINAKEGRTGQLFCTYDQSLLALSDFTIADLSTVDYFHPSLAGQAKMAADAWKAGVWESPTP